MATVGDQDLLGSLMIGSSKRWASFFGRLCGFSLI